MSIHASWLMENESRLKDLQRKQYWTENFRMVGASTVTAVAVALIFSLCVVYIYQQ